MSECRSSKLVYNGSIIDKSQVEMSMFYAKVSLYEVVRVIDGVVVFLDDHLERLENSINASGNKMLLSRDAIETGVYNLIHNLSERNGNLKISFNYVGEIKYSLIYFIDALYPDNSMYKSGVPAILYSAVREYPEIKVSNYQLRSQIYDKLVRKKAFEAFLVNSDDCITEGSKTNVFFIMDKLIVTAPDGVVLAGITRKYILELCKTLGIPVDLRCMHINELDRIESIFITGTSPKVLPVASVEDYSFNVKNRIIELLMSGFDDLIKEDVLAHRTD